MQEGPHQAGITALDPAVAAQNIRDSVEPGACKEALAVFDEFGHLSDTNSEVALMLTMSAGLSFQRKTTIVSPEMVNQSCYHKTGLCFCFVFLWTRAESGRFFIAIFPPSPCPCPKLPPQMHKRLPCRE